MKKSINLYFDNHELAKDKLLKIKAAGFDEFFTGLYAKQPDWSVEKQCAFAKTLGLPCTMIHCSYYEPDLHYFWEDGIFGDKICQDYCSQIRRSCGLTKNFVVHLNAEKEQKQSLIGLQRIKQMLAVCEECNMNLCVENLYSATEIPYIFKHIQHEKLKICFDVGHKNFLTPDFEILKDYHEFVAVLHLHDNHGKADEHLACGLGNVDWRKFATELRLIPSVVLSCEVKKKETDMLDNQAYLQKVLEGLLLIESYLK